VNERSSSPRPWKAAILAFVQLVLMGCIILGLFTCFVGWRAASQGVSPVDLLPRVSRDERTTARRHVPATPGSEKVISTPPATPAPGADEGRETEGQQPAVPPPGAAPPASRVDEGGVTSPPAADASRGLFANLPTQAATRLVIPSLGVDAPVVLIPARDGTWDISQITQEVGHLQGTANPGDPSNVVLAGHITLEQGGYGPFKSLAHIKTGETATVYVGEKQYTYTIRSLGVVAPDNVEVAYSTHEPILTLITCANWDKVTQRYKDRIVAVGYLAQ
jgi:LPXTG-site transpeptidase (sortase) family protein